MNELKVDSGDDVPTHRVRTKRCACSSPLDSECHYFCHLDIIWINTPRWGWEKSLCGESGSEKYVTQHDRQWIITPCFNRIRECGEYKRAKSALCFIPWTESSFLSAVRQHFTDWAAFCLDAEGPLAAAPAPTLKISPVPTSAVTGECKHRNKVTPSGIKSKALVNKEIMFSLWRWWGVVAVSGNISFHSSAIISPKCVTVFYKFHLSEGVIIKTIPAEACGSKVI